MKSDAKFLPDKIVYLHKDVCMYIHKCNVSSTSMEVKWAGIVWKIIVMFYLKVLMLIFTMNEARFSAFLCNSKWQLYY